MMKRIKIGTYAAPIASLVALVSLVLLTAPVSGLAEDLMRLVLLMGVCVLITRFLEKNPRR